jgi:signal transduction histidine kinase
MLILARCGPGGLSGEEASLLRGMARVTSMTMRILRLLDDERAAREHSDRQAAENARLLDALTERQALLERLAQEQAALRRVATLVAGQAPAEDIFAAVAQEVGRLLGADMGAVCRYESDGSVSLVASWSEAGIHIPVGTRTGLEGRNVSAMVLQSGGPARLDSYEGLCGPLAALLREHGIRSSVGAPILVDGRVWGSMIACSNQPEPFPTDSEQRLAAFTELVATAISNAQARSDLARLAQEQTALRRVATLVARGVSPAEVFAAVTEEVGRLLGLDLTSMLRFEPDDTATVVAQLGWKHEESRIGDRWEIESLLAVASVRRTGRSARVDDTSRARGRLADLVRDEGIRCMVAGPIVVEGRLWGAIGVGSRRGPLPADTEQRMADFTELLATAVANAESRAQLTASRARIVAASDETRRRIERDLHDGIQQRLVTLALQLRGARDAMAPVRPELLGQLSHLEDGLNSVLDELREISRGVHPSILSEGGLGPALKSLARRSAVAVELELTTVARLPQPLEAAAYYVVSEALANAAKHANASLAQVSLQVRDTRLHLSIRDDGIGGADPTQGSGILGLTDRVEALGGTLKLVSPARRGTTLHVSLPLPDDWALGGRRGV